MLAPCLVEPNVLRNVRGNVQCLCKVQLSRPIKLGEMDKKNEENEKKEKNEECTNVVSLHPHVWHALRFLAGKKLQLAMDAIFFWSLHKAPKSFWWLLI